VTAPWCPYTLPATRFWRDAAASVGRELAMVDAERDEGAGIITGAGIAGVPCLVAGPGRLRYGYQLSFEEARAFVSGGDEAPPLRP